jgi:hypothetical protein
MIARFRIPLSVLPLAMPTARAAAAVIRVEVDERIQPAGGRSFPAIAGAACV